MLVIIYNNLHLRILSEISAKICMLRGKVTFCVLLLLVRNLMHIDSGTQTIVGTNKYRLEHEDPLDILEVDNTAVRLQQEG
ncbi:MAG: hypothetical protein IIT68_05085, partial [Treponema sp.]|nr:hypothetical protein [Treponema sp.]